MGGGVKPPIHFHCKKMGGKGSQSMLQCICNLAFNENRHTTVENRQRPHILVVVKVGGVRALTRRGRAGRLNE